MKKNHLFITYKLFLFFIIITLPYESLANKNSFKPYFASIKSSEANVRIGPNIRYPIKWIFVKKYEPLEVVAKFEKWLKIRDIHADEGWVHSSMVSNKRYAVAIGEKIIKLYKSSDLSSPIIAEIEAEKRFELISCRTSMCLIEIANFRGWIERNNIWGLYPEEELK